MTTGRSSILNQNAQQSAFLIDIPASIETAQSPHFSPVHARHENGYSKLPTSNPCYRRIFSSTPLEQPYPSPPEPKSEAARARLLSRVPESEIRFHESISPLIRSGIENIQRAIPNGSKWCGSRRARSDVTGIRTVHEQNPVSEPARKKMKANHSLENTYIMEGEPPLILSPSSINYFADLTDLHGLRVKNPAPSQAAELQTKEAGAKTTTRYTIPPASSFILGNLSSGHLPHQSGNSPVPGLPSTEKFDIILFDPPWPNRSVHRSSQYPTHGYLQMDSLVQIIQQTILSHLKFVAEKAMVGIWTTNNAKSRQAAYDAFQNTGLEIFEIWIWVKVTENGELVWPLDGLWRKPYEVLFLGRPRINIEQGKEPIKRIIAAVPDEHSRKPNVKEVLELLFFRKEEEIKIQDNAAEFNRYAALEVFARNLTAGWCSCGNDVLKFNCEEWWYLS